MSKQAPTSKRRPKSAQLSSLATSAGPSALQILDKLNPMKSVHFGYKQISQSVVEEGGEDNLAPEDVDLEAGPSNFRSGHGFTRLSSKAEGKRRISWDASEMSILHPNIHKEDKIHEQDSSDDEVPQDFKVEATHAGLTAKFAESSRPARGQALYSTSGRKLPPSLPTVVDQSNSPSPHPQPSERHEHKHTLSPSTRSSSLPRQTRFVSNLDDYQRALWNWVNVFNLDAFLQEVYYYYEGHGIYSIALARGLNLL